MPNVASGAQIDSYAFSRSIVTGEVMNVTVNGSGITQNFTSDSATTLAALAAQIDGVAGVSATPAGSTIVLTAEVPGIPFTAGTLTIDMSVAGTNITPNVFAVTQIESVTAPRSLVAGDVIGMSVNGSGVTVSYSGSEAATMADLSSKVDALSGVSAISS